MIQVTYASISGGAQEVRGISGNIQGELADVKAGSDRIASGWTGNAQDNYATIQRGWDQDVQKLGDLLNQISTALDQTAQEYQDTEQRNASVWG
jgi:WXG100 family type VII secretion target